MKAELFCRQKIEYLCVFYGGIGISFFKERAYGTSINKIKVDYKPESMLRV
ncbi:hypothetical protein [Ilyobacter sp.]|uniref:hypothetical protein n=1 Tax=Ilyobacter sp. TaxID=3100343 RepID=UPI00356AACF2